LYLHSSKQFVKDTIDNKSNTSQGVKEGPAVYTWKGGHREDFQYDKGSKTGPSVLTGASGANRKGRRVNGEWHGPAVFTAPDGDQQEEAWDHGKKM